MSKKVKISDYEQDRHEALIALNMVGIQVDYITLDLMWDIMTIHRKKGGKVNISDCVKAKTQHDEKWDNYFKKQDEENSIKTK
jgi:hypothetical protein